ncbi:MAG: nucleotidyl transferase AbiEii/AbiGii toxin family protein [Calditrichia bacterium]
MNHFILKGATLFIAWSEDRYRPTKDLDFLGFGDASAPALKKIFQEICDLEVEKDGLQFDRNSVKIVEIREGMDYPGKRITLIAFLGKARINLRIDIGFGDKVFPEALWQHFPTLLNLPKPWIRMYSPESVIAEKLHTIVNLGIANSRMRDYYDLFRLSEQFNFKGAFLTNAVKQTFERRDTAIPEEVPLGLSPSFSNDRNKQTQWKAFIKKNNVHGIPDSLETVINRISIFLEPILKAVALGDSFSKIWKAGVGWE